MAFNYWTYCKTILMALTLLGAVSCQEEELAFTKNDINVELDTPITFVAKGTQTKAMDVTSLSQIYVRAIRGDVGRFNETQAFASAFSLQSDGFYRHANIYWPSSSVSFGFYASNLSDLYLSTSGTYILAQNSTDVVVATAFYVPYKGLVELYFEHIFAKIGYCKVISPDGYTVSNLKATFQPYIAGNYYPYDKTWGTKSQASSAVTLATAVNNTTSRNILAVPGTYIIALQYVLTKGSYSETFLKTISMTVQAGKQNNLEITLPKGNDATPEGDIYIEPWNPGGGDSDPEIWEEM